MRSIQAERQWIARLGSSVQVKSQVSGNEDLHIDGTVEGLVQPDERKVTVRATVRLTADITAREVAWHTVSRSRAGR